MLIFAFSTNSHMQHLAPPKPSVCCGFSPSGWCEISIYFS